MAAFVERLDFINKLKALLKDATEQTHEIAYSAANNAIPPLSGASLATKRSGMAGIRKQLDDLKKQAEASSRYTEEIGRAAGFILDSQPHDWDHMVPEFELRMVAGHVRVIWKKGEADAVEIESDYGGDELDSQGTILRTPYIDPTELPKQPQVWKYRLRYQHGDDPVGEWSDIREITVKAA